MGQVFDQFDLENMFIGMGSGANDSVEVTFGLSL